MRRPYTAILTQSIGAGDENKAIWSLQEQVSQMAQEMPQRTKNQPHPFQIWSPLNLRIIINGCFLKPLSLKKLHTLP